MIVTGGSHPWNTTVYTCCRYLISFIKVFYGGANRTWTGKKYHVATSLEFGFIDNAALLISFLWHNNSFQRPSLAYDRFLRWHKHDMIWKKYLVATSSKFVLLYKTALLTRSDDKNVPFQPHGIANDSFLRWRKHVMNWENISWLYVLFLLTRLCCKFFLMTYWLVPTT